MKIKVNGKKEFTIEKNSIDAVDVNWDLIEVRENSFHIIKDNKGYNATLVSFNREEKKLVINVNGNDYELSFKDKNDLLLERLGIAAKSSTAIQNIKAPMPGMIINTTVNEGDEVQKGDTLLILEAMKMENAIKSPRDGKIKKVLVRLKQTVEKNQVMVEFEV